MVTQENVMVTLETLNLYMKALYYTYVSQTHLNIKIHTIQIENYLSTLVFK